MRAKYVSRGRKYYTHMIFDAYDGTYTHAHTLRVVRAILHVFSFLCIGPWTKKGGHTISSLGGLEAWIRLNYGKNKI